MTRRHGVGPGTPAGAAYVAARAAIHFNVIVARTGRLVGVDFPGTGGLTAVDVETVAGEPSGLDSDLCSASVSTTGPGVTMGLFMPMTFSVRRNAACKAVRVRRLSLNAHGVGRSDCAGRSSCFRRFGARTCTPWKSTVPEQSTLIGCGACAWTPTPSLTSERP